MPHPPAIRTAPTLQQPHSRLFREAPQRSSLDLAPPFSSLTLALVPALLPTAFNTFTACGGKSYCEDTRGGSLTGTRRQLRLHAQPDWSTGLHAVAASEHIRTRIHARTHTHTHRCSNTHKHTQTHTDTHTQATRHDSPSALQASALLQKRWLAHMCVRTRV